MGTVTLAGYQTATGPEARFLWVDSAVPTKVGLVVYLVASVTPVWWVVGKVDRTDCSPEEVTLAEGFELFLAEL